MRREFDVFENIERQISRLIRRADVTKAVDNMILDRSAYFLLGQLDSQGPQTISSIANTFLLDISTISRQITALESKGLVERVANPENARVNLLTITALGERLYLEMRDKRVSRYREILAEWCGQDRAELSAFLNRLNDSIDVRANRWLQEGRNP